MSPLLEDASYILQQVVPGTVQVLEKAYTHKHYLGHREIQSVFVVHLEKQALWNINYNIAKV